MAVASPKVSLHLYLNNPYGLLSATIPNYDIYTPDRIPSTSPSPNGGTSPFKFHTPLPEILEIRETTGPVGPENDSGKESSTNAGSKVRLLQDGVGFKSTLSSIKHVQPSTDSRQKEVPADRDLHITPRSKSTSGQSAETNISEESSPRLGFTWSINVDKEKRRRRQMPPRPPPDSILQKLGCNKNIEPVGIIKIKRPNYPQAQVSSYHIQKLALNDKGQRRVSEKLAEWLDQYNEVSLKQQEYLKKIHTLRRSLQNTDDKRMTVTFDRMRGTLGQKEEPETNKHRRKYPVYTLTRLERSVINNGPKPFPNRPLIVHTDEKPNQKPNIKLVPNAVPRKLAPIVKKIKTPKGTTSLDATVYNQPMGDMSPRPEMQKMTTEYEPFESIARRNRLNLHQFLNPSIAIGQKSLGKRMPVAMSNVRIINEVAEAHSDITNAGSPTMDGMPSKMPLKKAKVENRPD